ncbi:hypothetical protein Moror_3638 [Moniliophthora roreri MCA 2997]|uniref:Uncharacterized protein n=1 Tax=Moniliophthora roreri (strain MCA 2997) TaxID=1381753 RepID=V2WX19_MONRO|nr:hypothetical protein Moror_3638 [Moniliophthora roreri MCA 2997]
MDLDHPENPYASGVGLESDVINPNGSSFGHDNDDGIAIIDVTDPVNPVFCHFRDGDGPLSSEQYVRQYHPIPSKESTRVSESGRDVTDEDEEYRFGLEDVLRHIASLEGIPLLPRAEEKLQGKQHNQPRSSAVPSLADLAICPAMDHCLHENDWARLGLFFDIPVEATLTGQALHFKHLVPDAGAVVLSRLLSLEMEKNDGVLDLVGTLLSWAVTSAYCYRPADIV